jgi:hypothetical protein
VINEDKQRNENMDRNERKIARGSLIGPIKTTSGSTYLRLDDVSAITTNSKNTEATLVDIHMKSGTIFTVYGSEWRIVQSLGIPIEIVNGEDEGVGIVDE